MGEAATACMGGADVIDCKDPSCGALGPWPRPLIDRVRCRLGRLWPLSVAAGDPKPKPSDLLAALDGIGVDVPADWVKIGIHRPDSTTDWRDLIDAAGAWPGARRHSQRRLIGVLFADQYGMGDFPFDLVARFRAGGFAGVMIDTAHKGARRGAGLVSHMRLHDLIRFCRLCRRYGLVSGLAGSLRMQDIAVIGRVARPDYLGLRGAVCAPRQSRLPRRCQPLCRDKVAHAAHRLAQIDWPHAPANPCKWAMKHRAGGHILYPNKGFIRSRTLFG